MSEFLKRNKKKGALAFLLLLLQRGKGLGPLLFLLLLLSFFFVAPSGVFLNNPWLDAIGRRLGLRSGLGSGSDSTDLAAYLDAARGGKGAGRGLGLLGGWFGRGSGDSMYGKNSTDMVKAGKELADGMRGGEKMYDDVSKGAGRSVDGVLRPEDAKQMENGVAVSEDEMEKGLLAQAVANQALGGMGNGVGDLGALAGGGGAGSSAFAARAADPKGGMLASTFGNNRLLNTFSPRGASSGRIGWKGGHLSFTMNAAGLAPHAGSQSAIYQVAEGKAYSVAAAPPPGNCDPGNCPSEFASNASGAVFDGGQVSGNIISGPNDPGVNIPPQGQIDTLVNQADQAEQDAQKCDQADQTYGPQEHSEMDQIQSLSNQLNSMGCNSGGCSSSKYHACMAVGNQMKVVCAQYNQTEAAKYAACPLLQQSGTSSQMDCNQ